MTEITDILICPECGRLTGGRRNVQYHRSLALEQGYCPECGEELEPARLCHFCGEYRPASTMNCDIEEMCAECFKDGMKRLGALADASEDPCTLAVLGYLCAV